MAISDELTRIQTAKADIKTAIEAKGVTVPSSALIDEYDTYIAQISGGGSSDLRDLLEKDITSVDIPDGTTKIGSYAFIECTSLASVSIPNSVTRIENDAFNTCSSLTSINIPNSVTIIGSGAFHHCTGLTRVTIGNGVTTIGPSAFQNCPNLTEITIPSGVSVISLQAFYTCRGLTSVTVEATTPPSLGTNAFDSTNNCPIYVPAASVEAYKAATNWSEYADRIFAMPIVAKFNVTDTTNPTRLIYYDSTWAPDTKNSFSKMVIDGVVQNSIITEYSFNTTGEHTVRYLLSDPTTIGDFVFESCSNLTSVSIPNSVTTIGQVAFYDCRGLTSVSIPNGVTTIGQGAFYDCPSLTSITVEATTPPSLANTNAFNGTNNCPIYVPSASVNAYKTATNWSTYADRIQAIPTT